MQFLVLARGVFEEVQAVASLEDGHLQFYLALVGGLLLAAAREDNGCDNKRAGHRQKSLHYGVTLSVNVGRVAVRPRGIKILQGSADGI